MAPSPEVCGSPITYIFLSREDPSPVSLWQQPTLRMSSVSESALPSNAEVSGQQRQTP